MTASQRGHHPKTISPIMDREFRDRFCSYVRAESKKKGAFSNTIKSSFNLSAYSGQPHLTSAALANWVNSELELEENENYSARCMQHWLHKCGFKV